MTIPNQCLTQEQILTPLRELYRRDLNHRKAIAEYANNFKQRGVFLRNEADFLQKRLSLHNIDFNSKGVSSSRSVSDGNNAPTNHLSYLKTETILLPVKLLTVELVPSTCWFSNVRDHVSRKTWDKLRKMTYKQANYRCEVCGGRGDKWAVECHEIWHYDDPNYIQTLAGLTALCPSCHQVKHIGLAGLRGYGKRAEAHLAKINGWKREQTDAYLETVWDTWHERSSHDWSLDLDWLNRYGIYINPKR